VRSLSTLTCQRRLPIRASTAEENAERPTRVMVRQSKMQYFSLLKPRRDQFTILVVAAGFGGLAACSPRKEANCLPFFSQCLGRRDAALRAFLPSVTTLLTPPSNAVTAAPNDVRRVLWPTGSGLYGPHTGRARSLEILAGACCLQPSAEHLHGKRWREAANAASMVDVLSRSFRTSTSKRTAQPADSP
jgi:hypothetical protein